VWNLWTLSRRLDRPIGLMKKGKLELHALRSMIAVADVNVRA